MEDIRERPVISKIFSSPIHRRNEATDGTQTGQIQKIQLPATCLMALQEKGETTVTITLQLTFLISDKISNDSQ